MAADDDDDGDRRPEGGGGSGSGLVPADLGIGRLFWAIPDAVVVSEQATGRVVL